MKDFFNKYLTKKTFLTRFLLIFILFLLLFLVTSTPNSLWKQIILAIALSLWFTFLTDFLISRFLSQNSYCGPIILKRIFVNKESISISSSFLKRIPNIVIDYTKSFDNDKMYGVCFLISPNTYIVLDILDGDPGDYRHEIYSDILLAAFNESKKSLITTRNKEIILSFIELNKTLNILDKITADSPILTYNLRYPYIKY